MTDLKNAHLVDEDQLIAETVTEHHEHIDPQTEFDMDAIWSSWEVQEALARGDIDRATELAELHQWSQLTWM